MWFILFFVFMIILGLIGTAKEDRARKTSDVAFQKRRVIYKAKMVKTEKALLERSPSEVYAYLSIKNPSTGFYDNRMKHTKLWNDLVDSNYQDAVVDSAEMFLDNDGYDDFYKNRQHNSEDTSSDKNRFKELLKECAIKQSKQDSCRRNEYKTAIVLHNIKQLDEVRFNPKIDGFLSILKVKDVLMSHTALTSDFFKEYGKLKSLSAKEIRARKLLETIGVPVNLTKIEMILSHIFNAPFRHFPQGGKGDFDNLKDEEISSNMLSDTPYTLYLVKIKNEVDGLKYLKVGVTKERSVEKRFQEDEQIVLEEVYCTATLPHNIALMMEQRILYNYRPSTNEKQDFNLYARFNGYTEVLDFRKLSEIRAGFDTLDEWYAVLLQDLSNIKEADKKYTISRVTLRTTYSKKGDSYFPTLVLRHTGGHYPLFEY